MPITWILRVRSAQAHSAAVVEALGGPGVLLPAGEGEVIHLYECAQEAAGMAALAAVLVPLLEQARQLSPATPCTLEVHLRFPDGQDCLAVLPPALLQALAAAGACLELCVIV